ncbi:uncharacterized protein LOC111244147 [Varroa destructor]|uniref:Uncharacterized protein n=1 Tax=Varroa destructor TaxID=109461 RepID=A0A7M7JEA2_VARDE|nr:uncharacterized protein LOC111244147 [Varroa destructor]
MKLFMIFCVGAFAHAASLGSGRISTSVIADVAVPAVDLKKELIADLKSEAPRGQEATLQSLKKNVEEDTAAVAATNNVQQKAVTPSSDDQKKDTEKRFLLPGFGGYRGLHGARESYTNVAAVRHYGAFGGYVEPYGNGFEVPVGGLSVGPALGLAVPGIFYG